MDKWIDHSGPVLCPMALLISCVLLVWGPHPPASYFLISDTAQYDVIQCRLALVSWNSPVCQCQVYCEISIIPLAPAAIHVCSHRYSYLYKTGSGLSGLNSDQSKQTNQIKVTEIFGYLKTIFTCIMYHLSPWQMNLSISLTDVILWVSMHVEVMTDWDIISSAGSRHCWYSGRGQVWRGLSDGGWGEPIAETRSETSNKWPPPETGGGGHKRRIICNKYPLSDVNPNQSSALGSLTKTQFQLNANLI